MHSSGSDANGRVIRNSKYPSLMAKRVICPVYEPTPMDLGDSLYFRAKHTLKLLEAAEVYMKKGYTILSLEAKTNCNGEADMIVEKEGLWKVVELKTKWRIESWDIFQAVLYAEPGMAVDIVDGANNIGQLDSDRVEEIQKLLIHRLSTQTEDPVPSKLCRYCSNYDCKFNDQNKLTGVGC